MMHDYSEVATTAEAKLLSQQGASSMLGDRGEQTANVSVDNLTYKTRLTYGYL
jgi:hypothetical protein